MNKSYKCRIYPNKDQVRQIELTFSACRFVYNSALELKREAYEYDKRSISFYDLSATVPLWKSVKPWLREADSVALIQSLRHLDAAYKNFFRRVKQGGTPGFPKFKSKRNGNQSYRTQKVSVIDERHIRLPKLGSVKCKGLATVDGRIVSATVRRVPSGKYYVSLCCDGVPEPEAPEPKVETLGIDVGVRDLMVRSDGIRVDNPKLYRKSLKRLRREQRRLSRMQKGSANWKKQKLRVARLYERVSNQRSNLIHEATTQAVRDAAAIAVEDLNIDGMKRNHHLAMSVSDASMGEAIRQLEYKSEWYGRDFVKVGRWFPSTQNCYCCGAKAGPKGFDGLKVREWTCPECGARNDRDLNSALCIAEEGRRLLDEKATTE